MKPSAWFAQSFFVHTLWLVLGVVLFSKALTVVYLLLNEDVLLDRQYSHGAALTLRAFWATTGEQRKAVAANTGLRLRTNSEVPSGESHWPYGEVFQKQMQMELGEDTETRLRIRQPPVLWVRAPSLGEGWVEVPLYPHPLRGQRIWSVLGWFLLIGLCSTAAAWIFVRQLSAPLKRLIKAVRRLGQGQSVRLPVNEIRTNEMAELYRAFNQMAENIEQATRERELMLAGVSHDLRTPLTRLRLALELQAVEDDLSADMIRDIEDMDGILDQFLAFIRDGRAEPLELCNLNELVRETVAAFNQHDPRIALQLQDIEPLLLRRLSIKRLLSNLLENALQHTGGAVEVATSLSGEKSRHAVLCVLDHGTGIAEGELEHICNPFTRGNQARSGRGTGLGLAIVKRIAQQHGGCFELKNREGGGLKAQVCLPMQAPVKAV